MASHKFIKLKEVINLTSLSRSSIYDKIQKKKFPPQIILGGKSVAWVESEIFDWIDNQIQNSRNIHA